MGVSDGPPEPAVHHALIAGTGRSGTSFLVRFLAACGLDTGDAPWSARAHAGHEHTVDIDDPSLPYVVKDPFLFRYCRQLDLDRLTVDALILPIRNLTEAAESRVLQERLALTARPFLPHEEVETLAATPGGVVFSLNVVDQERLLAVGFHELLHWGLTNQLPLFLLDFPRLVEDRDYLVDSLAPWLKRHCDLDRARAAFAETADATRGRVRPSNGGAARAAAHDLDRMALIERVEELTAAIAAQPDPPTPPAPPAPATPSPAGEWRTDELLVLDGIEFTVTTDADHYPEQESAADHFVLAKDRRMVETLIAVLASLAPARIVELGIFKGGSTALIALLTRPQTLTAVDFSPTPVPALDEFIVAAGLEAVVRPHHGVDQSDARTLAAVVDADHGGEPLDLVIDDASHLYRETRASFALLFPRLRPGGLFMIEDWAWAHYGRRLWQTRGGWFHDRPALTNLIIELTMIAGTSPDLIPKMTVVRDWVIVERGPRRVEGALRLEDHYENRGLPFRPLL